MRVLYFTRDYTSHDHRFLTALAQTEHEVFLLRLEMLEAGLEDRVVPERVKQVVWGSGKKPAGWQVGVRLRNDLRKVIHQIRPDLIHAGPIQKSALLTTLAGFHPLVSMSWGSDLLVEADRNPFWRWATRYTLMHSDVLLGDCQAVADKAASFGFDPARIVLFPWGVDLYHFQPAPSGEFRNRLGWEHAFILLSLRSWEPLYGVDVFLRGFVRAARKIPEMRLLLLGSGSQAARLRSILIDADMLDRVHFGGQVSQADLPRYYQSADLYVSASHSDGSSVSLMEALACGLPVLVSDIPGNREWIEHGQQGWLFPDGDEQAIYTGILLAYQQRNQLFEMHVTARKKAEERADWTKNFQRLLYAYELAVEVSRKYGR